MRTDIRCMLGHTNKVLTINKGYKQAIKSGMCFSTTARAVPDVLDEKKNLKCFSKYVINFCLLLALGSTVIFSSCKSEEKLCNLKPKGNWTIDPDKCEYVCELPSKAGYNIDNCEYVCALTALPGYEITDSCTYVAIVTPPDTTKISIPDITTWNEKNPTIEALLAMPNSGVTEADFPNNINASISDLYNIVTRYVTAKNSAPTGKLVEKWNNKHTGPINGQQSVTPAVLGGLTDSNNGTLTIPIGPNQNGDKFNINSQYKDYLLSILVNPNDTMNFNIVYPTPTQNFIITNLQTIRDANNAIYQNIEPHTYDISGQLGEDIPVTANMINAIDSLTSAIINQYVNFTANSYGFYPGSSDVDVQNGSSIKGMNDTGTRKQIDNIGTNQFYLVHDGVDQTPYGEVVKIQTINASDPGFNPGMRIPQQIILDQATLASTFMTIDPRFSGQIEIVPVSATGLDGGQYPILGMTEDFINNTSQTPVPKSDAMYNVSGSVVMGPYGSGPNPTDLYNGHTLVNIDNRVLAWVMVSTEMVNDPTLHPLPQSNPPFRTFNITTNNPDYMDDGRLVLTDVNIMAVMYMLLCRGPITTELLNNVTILLTNQNLINTYIDAGAGAIQYVLNYLGIDHSSVNVEIVMDLPAGKSAFPLDNVTELVNGIPASQSAPRNR